MSNLKPAYAMQLLEMRRFGDRRPSNNNVVITDNRMVAEVCRKRLGIFVLVVEPFLPYNLGCCFDLDVWVVMDGDSDRVRASLRRVGPRSLRVDPRGAAFWQWIEWLVERRAGRAGPDAIAWHAQRESGGRSCPGRT